MPKRVRTVVEEMEERVEKGASMEAPFEGSSTVVSTGSTLLDLAISGGRFPYGGVPGGILVEIFGPAGAGKTVLLCEMAGAVQRANGSVLFYDPEGRLNRQFSTMMGVDFDRVDYSMPETIRQVFGAVREWVPKSEAPVHGVFADSLAALTTELEMDGEDKYGMRRAKEFSEQLRLTCRELAKKNYLMVASNQVRQNLDAGPYGQRYTTTGGVAVGFYASLRLRFGAPEKIVKKRKVQGRDLSKVIGVETEIEVVKSSVWEPYHKAKVCILFNYGVDDIRANLQYVKEVRQLPVYMIGDRKLSNSLDQAVQVVEEEGLAAAVRDEVVALWREIQEEFREARAPKVRY